MTDIKIPIFKINTFAKNPEKLNNNTFKFFCDNDYEISQETSNLISCGFILKDILFKITPSDIYKDLNCISNSFISEGGLLVINALSYEKIINNKYVNPFALSRKIIKKDTCIFYLSIVTSEYEKNYILDIII